MLMVIKYLKVMWKLMDIVFCIYVYYEFCIIISKILINCWKKDFFFIFDGNLFYRIVIGGKEFVYIV